MGLFSADYCYYCYASFSTDNISVSMFDFPLIHLKA